MKTFLKYPFEHMLQGLAYWLAYQREATHCKIMESDAVKEACCILQTHMYGYIIEREVLYSDICSFITNRKRADIAIKNRNGCYECIVEFKLADSTNGGFIEDLEKMHELKKHLPDIDCYSVILYRKSCSLFVPYGLVDKNGKAFRKTRVIPKKKPLYKISVRRVCNAICSQTAKKMKKVVCIELV